MEQNNKISQHSKRINNLMQFILSDLFVEGEEWREIADTDGKYFISSYGRVLSLCRNAPLIMKPFGDNYYQVSINNHDVRVNRLVAQAFLDNPENKPIVHHIDGNKKNNHINNLMWATQSENMIAYFESKNTALKE